VKAYDDRSGLEATFLVETLDGSWTTDQYAEFQLEQGGALNDDVGEYRKISSEERQLTSGQTAWVITEEWVRKQNDFKHKGIEVFAVVNSYGYSLYFEAPEAEFETVLPMINRAIEGLRIENSKVIFPQAAPPTPTPTLTPTSTSESWFSYKASGRFIAIKDASATVAGISSDGSRYALVIRCDVEGSDGLDIFVEWHDYIPGDYSVTVDYYIDDDWTWDSDFVISTTNDATYFPGTTRDVKSFFHRMLDAEAFGFFVRVPGEEESRFAPFYRHDMFDATASIRSNCL
jgi:hypothetical protein